MSRKKILIVFKNEQWHNSLKQNLSDYPYDIISTDNGNDGFELAKQEKPAIILASTQLPGIDGINLCWMIRHSPELSKIPFIIFTEFINQEEKINAFRSGVDAILENGTSIREIYTRIEAIIKRTEQISNTKNNENSNSLRGKLPHFTVVEILQMLNLSKKSGTLTFTSEDKQGEIGFWEGKIVWAKQNSLNGEDAVKEIACWNDGSFHFEKDLIHPTLNINTPSMQLILDCCKLLDEKIME